VGNDLLFGSEVKTILAYRGQPPELDQASLGSYFAFGFVPLSRTPFRGLAKLPPGHVIEARLGTLATRRYWDVDLAPDEASRVEAPDEILAALENAVRSHLVADVPVGAFLSGGLDSSAVVRLMRDAGAAPVKTFSVGFADRSYDERPFARAIASALGTDHHEVVCTADEFASLWRTTVWHADGLAADISNVPLYLLARRAREEVPVVLSGDGADELFGGYPTYQADRLAAAYRHVPAPFRTMIGLVARSLPTSTGKMSFDYRLKQFLAGAEANDAAHSHFAWRRIFSTIERDSLLDPALRAMTRSDDTEERLATLFRDAPATHDLHRAIYADLKTFLVDSILAKVDAMTMAHGLEARVPFLDHRLVELAARIPERLKVRFMQGKRILRDAMRGRVPSKVIHRTKSPFQPPLAGWLRSDLREMVSDVLSEAAVGRLGFFDVSRVEALKRQHFSGVANHAFKLWNLLNFVEWHRLFVSGAWTEGTSRSDAPPLRPRRDGRAATEIR
jgi:asparagine synthase (glutamine-hydrolysing)